MQSRIDQLLIAMMEHEDKDVKRIQHLLKVHEFARLDWEETVIERVAWLVGHHHTYTDIDGADYQIFVEADFLVNLFESNLPAETQREVYRRILKTESGKRIFRTMFAWE